MPIDGPDDAILSQAAQDVTDYIEMRRAKTLHGELREFYEQEIDASARARLEAELVRATRELNNLAGELDDIRDTMAVDQETDLRDSVHDLFLLALHNVQWRIRRYHWTPTTDRCQETIRNTLDGGKLEYALVTFRKVQRECIRVFDLWRATFPAK